MQQHGDSIWGNINSCIEIALNVYYIYAEHGEGIRIAKDQAANTLSPKAIQMAEEGDEWLYYGEDAKDVALYEVLQKRIDLCKKIESKTLEQMQEIQRNGKLRLTDYFGECSPPIGTETEAADKMFQIRNGIYFVYKGEQVTFALHESVADNFLAPAAIQFGKPDGEYFYYDLNASAVPLNELQHIFTEAENLIISKESLNATLTDWYPAYTKLYNSVVPDEVKITYTDAPKGLFLGIQLERAAKKEEPFQAEISADEEEEYPEEYGEEVDYGFEP